MKCCECPEYKACRRKADLRKVRHRCSLAKAPPKPQTNADRIRAKSDEKLASFIATYSCPPAAERASCGGDCPECWLRWLKQPVKDGDNDG